ncbi:MAG: phospholipid carrier-dependent glycosyltransferase [Candidatus Curtissbacteria bacterium]|nr:phospholipid carrier-dependent glycosyltransferase [Candidatus Curtissbacteria bacterium]
MNKTFLYVLIFLTLVSFVIRIYRFTSPGKYYFDEVYHVVTAKAYSQNNPAAYDPFAPPPEQGTAYDWLHPPLAKLIQAGSIKVLGDNPVGWRLPSVIFGTAIIPLTFILATLLFGPLVGLFAAAVISFENLTFVMSRITMNDVFVVVFILLSLIFAAFYAKASKSMHIILSSIFLGLAISSKWSGVYAIPLVFGYLSYISFKKRRWDTKLLLTLLLPPLIYLLSYGQFWLQGHSVRQFIDLHKQILWYQNRHDLVHSYGTTPIYCVPEGLGGQKSLCPWVFDARGVYFSYHEQGGKAEYIYALGNPLIFWAGFVASFFLIGRLVEKRDKQSFSVNKQSFASKKKLALVLAAYFIFWVPWIFSPRIMFLYHYLPAIPFLSIALGIVLSDIYKTRRSYIAVFALVAFALVFFYLYPISSGYPIEIKSIGRYMWFDSWR